MVRSIYAFEFDPDRLERLVEGLDSVFQRTCRELCAFADFLETLMNLFEPPPDDAGPDSQALITNLQFAFFAGMDELTEALSSVKILPELSEPSGNGKAYEKFVAIYNQMLGVDNTGDEPEPEPTEPTE